jgi:hypothetical protein
MESRREKIRAALKVYFNAVSKSPARWYRLRTEDVTDEYSLSFLCNTSPKVLDKLLLAGEFLHRYGDGYRVLGKEVDQFLKASAADTEMVQSQVNGKKDYFVRIGTFGTSPHFTAIDQFASGMKSPEYEESTREAGNTFRQSVNEASETTEGTTVEKTKETTAEKTTEKASEEASEKTMVGSTVEETKETTAEKTAEKTTEKASEKTTVGSTEKTTEGITERSTEGTTVSTLPCTGWSGELHSKVVLLSTAALLRGTRDCNIPVKFPLCGSFRTRAGYNELEIRTTVAPDGSTKLAIRSKECHLVFPKEKKTGRTRKLCSACGPLVERVKQIRHQSHSKAINSDSNLHITENQVIQMTPAEIHAAVLMARRRSSNNFRNLNKRHIRAELRAKLAKKEFSAEEKSEEEVDMDMDIDMDEADQKRKDKPIRDSPYAKQASKKSKEDKGISTSCSENDLPRQQLFM